MLLRTRGALALVLTAALLGVAAYLAVPWWLTPEDRIERCAAVVVLNGDAPWRADEAARLYQAGVAPEIWLTIDPRSGSMGSDAGTTSNIRQLVARSVPRDVIHVLPGTAVGTRAELSIVRGETMRRAADCVIAVTSPVHARRVRVTWRHDAGETPRLVVRHAPHAGYAGWKSEARELVLSVKALLGFPAVSEF
jgi:uncharacterized SAM-binding protein YcdF (DUF218 family)